VNTIRKLVEFGSDFEEVTDSHPVTDLLSKANPYFNGFDLTTLRILYGELTGNAYMSVICDERLGVPTELWPMPSQWTYVNPDRDGFIKSYTYGAPGNEDLEFMPDEVIHFKRPNPNDLFYGMGKVEAAWGTINVNQAIHEMDQATFSNMARPDYAVIVKNGATTQSLERFESYVQEQLQGTKKAGSFLTMTGDVQLQPLNFPPKDLAGREDVVEEIAAVFGVPVSLLKANDPNLASARVGYSQWREGTILPLLRMDEDVLNQTFLPMFGLGDDAVLAYDNPVPADKEFELSERTALVASGLMTLNEAREEDGRDPYEQEVAEEPLINGMPISQMAQMGQMQNPMAGLLGQEQGGMFQVENPQGGDQFGNADQKDAIASHAGPTETIFPSESKPLNGQQISAVNDTLERVREGKLSETAARLVITATGIPESNAARMVEGESPSKDPKNPLNQLPQQNCADDCEDPEGREEDGVMVKDEATDTCVSGKIGVLMDEGYEHDQAVAIAREMCGKAVDGIIKDLQDDCDLNQDSITYRRKTQMIKNLDRLRDSNYLGHLIKASDCGSTGGPGPGSGGFKPGNDCGGRERTVSSTEASQPKRVSKLVRQIREEGGFTYNAVSDTSPTEGYAVSPFKELEMVVDVTTPKKGDLSIDKWRKNLRPKLRDYIRKNIDTLRRPNAHLGGWWDKDSNKVYIDISIVSDNLEDAMKVAKENDQEAIFDLGKMETISAR
jgi:HK97 family phage portal protein